MADRSWQVWGDDEDPILDGVTEQDAKHFVESDERDNLYIQSGEGDEFELVDGKWQLVN